MIGRLCSGAAPVDVASALLTMREGLIPSTAPVEPSSGCTFEPVSRRGPRRLPEHRLSMAKKDMPEQDKRVALRCAKHLGPRGDHGQQRRAGHHAQRQPGLRHP